jgi:type III secretion protein T
VEGVVDFLFTAFVGIGICIPRTMLALTFIPLFSFSEIKGGLKIAIVIAVTLPISVSTMVAIDLTHFNYVSLPFLIIKETMIGFLIGYLMAIPFWIFQSVGAMIDNQRGALSAGYNNPASGPDASMLGDLLNKVVVLLFMEFGLFAVMFTVIIESYSVWKPLDSMPAFYPNSYEYFIGKFSGLAEKFVLYAGPVVLVLLLVEAAFAILGTYSPQLQVYFMAMPAKALFAILILCLYFSNLSEFIVKEGELYHDLKKELKIIFVKPKPPA